MSIFRSSHPLFKIASGSLYDLPSPSSLSYMWNFGSVLGLFFSVQIVTGLILSMHYVSFVDEAFSSVIHLIRDVDSGFFFRLFHMNGASFFFIFVYMHVGRGLYFGSFKLHLVWNSGILILLVLMGVAFLGYVLPWGQMSFWGATVITNLISAVPYVGVSIVEWLWGGYSVGGATLTRFFSLHFLLPFVLLALVVVHLVFLHQSGSSNALGAVGDSDKVGFAPYFLVSDLYGLFFAFFVFLTVVVFMPYDMGDAENFNMANPMSTPVHIQPEWYFLFAYAILRSVPSKLGGVLFLVLSIVVFAVHSLFFSHLTMMKGFFFKKVIFWGFVGLFFLLTWLGSKPVEAPYEMVGRGVGVFYFLFAFLLML